MSEKTSHETGYLSGFGNEHSTEAIGWSAAGRSVFAAALPVWSLCREILEHRLYRTAGQQCANLVLPDSSIRRPWRVSPSD